MLGPRGAHKLGLVTNYGLTFRVSLNSTSLQVQIKAVRMSEERFCICSCESCGEHIEFPASGVGMRVACPHCAVETVLTETQERPAENLSRCSALS